MGGYYHTMIIKKVDSIWCTGWNSYGQCGLGHQRQVEKFTEIKYMLCPATHVPKASATTAPAPANGLGRLAVGNQHTLIIKPDGSLFGAGSFSDPSARYFFGELGPNPGLETEDFYFFAKIMESGAKAVDAGFRYSMVLKEDGSLWIGGQNEFGQHGNGKKSVKASDGFQQVVPSGVIAMSAGKKHSLILKKDGSVWAAGDNTRGQLGDGTTAARLSYVKVIPGGVAAIAAGDEFSVVMMTDGSVRTCGSNSHGTLGDKSYPSGAALGDRPKFEKVLDGALAICAGNTFTMVLKADGVYAAGFNQWGELGLTQDQVVALNKGISVMQGVQKVHPPGYVKTYDANYIKSLTCYGYTGMVLKNDGSVYSSGTGGGFGKLPNIKNTRNTKDYGFKKTYLTDVAEIPVGNHGGIDIVRKKDGTIWTAGFGYQSGLGSSHFTKAFTRQEVTNIV